MLNYEGIVEDGERLEIAAKNGNLSDVRTILRKWNPSAIREAGGRTASNISEAKEKGFYNAVTSLSSPRIAIEILEHAPGMYKHHILNGFVAVVRDTRTSMLLELIHWNRAHRLTGSRNTLSQEDMGQLAVGAAFSGQVEALKVLRRAGGVSLIEEYSPSDGHQLRQFALRPGDRLLVAAAKGGTETDNLRMVAYIAREIEKQNKATRARIVGRHSPQGGDTAYTA